MKIDARRQAISLQFGKTSVDNLTQLGYVGSSLHRHGKAQCPSSVIAKLVACGLFISYGNVPNIFQAQLIFLMSLNQQVRNIVDRLISIVNGYPQAIAAALEITGINGFILSVERSQHFGRMHAQIGHLILINLNIDTLRTASIHFYAAYIGNILKLAFQHLRIIVEFLFGITVARYGVKHTEYVAEIIHHQRRTRSVGQFALHVADTATQDVPILVDLFILYGTLQFDGDLRHIVERTRFNRFDTFHRSY